MGYPSYQSGINTIRSRIENISDEKAKLALMYQYLLCLDKAEVAGKNHPIGDDAKRTTISIADSSLDLVIFKIKQNKKNSIRYCVLPLGEQYDKWIGLVYSYMSKYGSDPPFLLHKKVSTSGSYLMKEAGSEFEGLLITSAEYSRQNVGTIPTRPVEVTSKHLKNYRMHELVFNYYFTSLDIALYRNWDDYSKIFENEIKDIIKEDQSKLDESGIINRSMPYLLKLLKKNENTDDSPYILTQVECYFVIYCYFEIKNGGHSDELIYETAHLLKKSVKDVLQLLNFVAYLDPSENTKKPFNASMTQSIMLKQMFDWFSTNQYIAKENIDVYSNLLSSNNLILYTNPEEIKKKSQQIYTEEGQRISQIFKMRKRSQSLVFEARRQYRKLDPENKLRCYACGFVKPDSINKEVVEIHHLTQLHELDDFGEKKLLSEVTNYVIPLCPTCHRIAHSGDILLSVDEIKNIRFQK